MVMIENLGTEELTVQVIGSDGRLVYDNRDIKAGLSEINLEHLDSGLYHVLVFTENFSKSTLVVIRH